MIFPIAVCFLGGFMAKTYLTTEELAENFPTIPDLSHDCKGNDPDRWGLRKNDSGFSFGIKSEAWQFLFSLSAIRQMSLREYGTCTKDSIIVYSTYDVNDNVACILLDLSMGMVLQPGPEIRDCSILYN